MGGGGGDNKLWQQQQQKTERTVSAMGPQTLECEQAVG